MPFTPALVPLLQRVLAPTSYCVDDMLALEMGDWQASVLLDNTEHLSSFDLLALSDLDLAGNTPLDIAYRLNRVALIERLEALGAVGNKKILEWSGLGSFIAHDKYVHLPGKQGKVRTLELRYRQGGSLNDRDVDGNTPIHLLALNGHAKAIKYFTDNYLMFSLDLNAKNNEGNTARNVAMLAGHQDIADQLLIREIDCCISAARIWHQMFLRRK